MIRVMREGGGAESGRDSEELEELLTSELVKRPRDYKLRASLLQLYLKKQRLTEAYTHASQVERMIPHPHCMTWYRSVLDVLQVGNHSETLSLSFWICVNFREKERKMFW